MPIKVQGCEVVTNNRKLINLDGAGVSGIVTSLVAGTGINISSATGRVTISGTQADTFWGKNTTGIHTTSNVGIGTTNVSSKLYLENGALTVSNTGVGTSNLYSSSLNNKTLSLLSHNSEFGDAKSPVIKIGRSHLLDDIKYSEREITYTDLNSESSVGFVLINSVAVYNRWWAAVNYLGGIYFGSGYGPIGFSTYISNFDYESVAIGLTGGNTYTNPYDLVYVVGAPNAATYGQVELWKRGSGIINVSKYATITRPAGANDFGYSVAIDNGIIAIGAPGSGEVYLYDTNGTFIRKMQSVGGYSVDIKNGKVIIGAPFYGASDVGRVYVYNIDGSDEFSIDPSDGQTNDYFGYSVAISDQFIVVGAPYADPLASASGAVYVYNLDGTGERKIVPSTGGSLDFFGRSVRIDSNNNLFVGAPGYGNNEGAVFRYNLIGPIKEDIITPSTNYSSGDEFGYSIDVDDSNNLVVGSIDDASAQGHLYFYNIGNTLEMEYLSEKPPAALGDPIDFPRFKISSTTYNESLSSNWAEKSQILSIGGNFVSIGNRSTKVPLDDFVGIGACVGYSVTTTTNNYNNTFIGAWAGRNHTSGNSNTYLGSSANYLNTDVCESVVIGSVGSAKTHGVAIGYAPDAPFQGISIGRFAGNPNYSGSISIGHHNNCYSSTVANSCNNISIGYSASQNSGGKNNIVIGTLAGCCSRGCSNIIIGNNAGVGQTYGGGNIIIGNYSTESVGNCNKLNISIGRFAGETVTCSKYESINIGYGAGRFATTDTHSINIGTFAGYCGSVTRSVRIGCAAGLCGGSSVAIGYQAAYLNTVCGSVAIGARAGTKLTTGKSILIGDSAGLTSLTDNTPLPWSGIPSGLVNTTTQNYIVIGNSDITNFYTKMAATGSGGNAVCWNSSTYELYSASSSARYKENIRPFLSGVKELVDIEPVTFTYIDRPDEPEQIGFIAEQLDEIGLTHFVNYDKDNRPDSVSYDRVIVLAINAIKELNNENQELKLRITQLENVVGISSSGSN